METSPIGGDKPFWTVFIAHPFDTLKLLFSEVNISVTVKHAEAKYANSGKGRPHYPCAFYAMLLELFMRFEATPSLRKALQKTGEETLKTLGKSASLLAIGLQSITCSDTTMLGRNCLKPTISYMSNATRPQIEQLNGLIHSIQKLTIGRKYNSAIAITTNDARRLIEEGWQYVCDV